MCLALLVTLKILLGILAISKEFVTNLAFVDLVRAQM